MWCENVCVKFPTWEARGWRLPRHSGQVLPTSIQSQDGQTALAAPGEGATGESGTFTLLKDCAPTSILSCSELKQTASGPPRPGGSNCFTACAPGSVQAAIEAVLGGLHGSGKSPPQPAVAHAWSGCWLPSSTTPPTFLPLHLTSHSS